ncbi:hypothetical protein ACFLZ9_01660 [Patescibacteria group bacterium]
MKKELFILVSILCVCVLTNCMGTKTDTTTRLLEPGKTYRVNPLDINIKELHTWKVKFAKPIPSGHNRYFCVVFINPDPASPIKTVKLVTLPRSKDETPEFKDIRFFKYGYPHIYVQGRTGMVDLYMNEKLINDCAACHEEITKIKRSL